MLRDGALSERQKFNIVLFSLALQSGEAIVGLFWAHGFYINAIAGICARLALALVGAWFCFNTNVRGDNRNIIERFLCLSVPLTLWLSLLPSGFDSALFYILYHFYGMGAYALWSRLFPAIQIGGWGCYILFYVALNYLIRITAGGAAASNFSASDDSTSAPIAAP